MQGEPKKKIGQEQERKELKKDEGHPKEMLWDSYCILPVNTQSARAMFAKMRNMKLIILGLGVQSTNIKKAQKWFDVLVDDFSTVSEVS